MDQKKFQFSRMILAPGTFQVEVNIHGSKRSPQLPNNETPLDYLSYD